MLSLSLLGRPQLSVDGRDSALALRKSWALLTLLAVGGPAPRPRIASLLWPRLDLATGRRNLRRELARLSEVGATGLLKADGDFLSLEAEVVLDLHRFEQACAEGRADDALALWRGPLADGLQIEEAEAFDDWLEAERRRLHERWRQALEAAARDGPPPRRLERLQALLADDPLQERHHRALIRHHLDAGHREAALAQYERCRALLAGELGLSPMAETEALVADLRAPAAAAVLPVQARLPGQLPFVGRAAEVSALEAAWSARSLCWIEGEGGVGKTRLATDFCAAHGAYAMARCRPGDEATPYAAFTRALRVLAGDELAAAGLPGWVTAELARVLPELGEAPPPMSAAEERARFHEACAQAWRVLGDDSFDAVVIDDWHHADSASAALLAFVAQRLGPASPRLLLLSRPHAAPGPLADAVALRLQLQPLPEVAVADLMRLLSGAGQPVRFADRLRRATGGNPYFIAETLRHLMESDQLRIDERGRWSTAFDAVTEDYRELPLPASVRDAVLARVQRLPEPARRLLEAASLAREPFAPALLAEACALSEVEALAAIEQALGAALLREHEQGGYAFAHDLAQQALASALPADRRRLAHRRLARAAQATHADPGLTAQHYEAGGEPALALPHRVRAGDDAMALFASAQALLHWRAALALRPAPAQAARLHVSCARACLDLGDGEGAQAALAALDTLLAGGGLAPEVLRELQTDAAELETVLHLPQRALPRISVALARMPAGAARIRALRVKAMALQGLARLADAQGACQEALLQSAGAEAHEARADILDVMALVTFRRGDAQAALAFAREEHALCLAIGDRRRLTRSQRRVGVMLLTLGEVQSAEAELQAARRLAAELHLVEAEREVMINLLKIHADRGDGPGMLALAEEAWNLSPTIASPMLRQTLLQARCFAHGLLGELGQCLVLAEQVLDVARASSEPVDRRYAVLALLDLYVLVGDFDRARALLDEESRAGADELGHYGIKLAMSRAFLEVQAGQPAAAREALAAAGDPARMQQVQDRAEHALRLAAIHWAEGDADTVLALLEPWRGELPTVEMRALGMALRLRAQHARGAVDAADWARARATLDSGQLPPTDALELQRALWRSAPDPAEARVLKDGIDATLARLAATLKDFPKAQAGYLARHASA